MLLKNVPNVVCISIDDLRYDCISAEPDRPFLEKQGVAEQVFTPHIDRFAASGVHFHQAVSAGIHTPPAHASIFTGLYPPRHGIRPFFKTQLYPHVRTLAELLSDTGYHCIHASDFPYFKLLGLEQGVHRSFQTGDLELFDYIKEHDSPLYLFLHFFDVHDPYIFSPALNYEENRDYRETIMPLIRECDISLKDEPYPYIRTFQAVIKKLFDSGAISKIYSLYIAGVNKFDRTNFSRTAARLEETGIFDNCLVILFSDHGEGPGKETFGHGGELRDETIRTPLIVSYPGSIPESRDITVQVRLIDIVPTIIDILNQYNVHIELPYELDGKSLMPIISGEETQHRQAYSEVWHHTLSGEEMRKFIDTCLERQEILTPQYDTYLHQRSLRRPPWKIVLEGSEITGSAVSVDAPDSDFVKNLFTSLIHRMPSEREIAYYNSFLSTHPAGRSMLTNELVKLDEFIMKNSLYNIESDVHEDRNLLLPPAENEYIQTFFQLKTVIDRTAASSPKEISEPVIYKTAEDRESIESRLRALGYL